MTQDLTQTAAQIVQFLAPYLPYLLKGGKLAAKKAFEKMGEQFSEEAWDQAKALWGKLRARIRARPAAQKAVQEAAAAPNNPDAQAALRRQVGELLAEDPALAAEVAAWLTRIDAYVRTGDVSSGGKVVGVRVEGLGHEKADIQSKVVVDGTVSGEVTGAELDFKG